MITMSKFGKYGRLGNQLFQWQFLSMLARKLNTELVLPQWQYSAYFKNPPTIGSLDNTIQIEEPHYKYDMAPYNKLDKEKNYDLLGYWQNEKYSDSKIEFTDDFRQSVRDKFYLARPTIAIGVRRADYIKEPHVYFQLPIHYYITALTHQFPDWREHNLIFITDDPDYCKLHFGCLKNAMFPDTKDIEAMCLMSQCDNIIMSNSTFYWWAAKLGNPKKVVQPKHLFTGSLLEKYGDINFFTSEEEDIRYKQIDAAKIDLTNVTFTIPVKYDHPDRADNLQKCVSQLQQYFNTNIIIGEQGGYEFFKVFDCNYMPFTLEKEFHRTKMLNEMAKAATTPFIANWDCDIVIPPMQILESVYRLQNGAEMVYPYDGIFHRIRHKQKSLFKDDIGVYSGFPPDGTPSFGGAVMWNRESFMRVGMENEYMISFGPEDIERMERAVALGIKIERTPGNLYHFAHHCGPDSSVSNPHFRANRALLEKQRAMSKEQLRDYVQSWPWHTPYTESWHESITDEAETSQYEVFKILGITPEDYVIDCGCGLGQWGVNVGRYLGIDYKVPVSKLLISEERYLEHDLRLPLNGLSKTKADIVLCLEVAEHIEEKYADTLIDNLCSLGDTIIFSAAIPYQGGNGHVNEQWQTYWADKFKHRGYEGYYDEEIRCNKNISLWYRQNLIVYKKNFHAFAEWEPEDFILPEYYLQIVKHLKH